VKVLMVSPSYHPIIGGTESFVSQLAQKANEKGIAADVMTFNMDQKWAPVNCAEVKRENGFNVFRVPAYNSRRFSFHNHTLLSDLFNVHVVPRMGFSKIFRDYDVLHFHDLSDLSFPFFSSFVGKKEKPTLLHCHTLEETYGNYKRNFLSRTVLRRTADYYLGLSSDSRNMLINLGVSSERIMILPNGVDTAVFRPDLNKKIKNLVLFVARLYRSKGLHVLLVALRRVKTPVHLVVIGPVGGDPTYLVEIRQIINLINNEKIHKVTCLGTVSKEELVEWFQRASVFVCPSLSESFGIVNIEALACATPVIATRVGGIPDIIEEGVNGKLVPPNDALSLSIALNELLVDEKLRNRLSKKGREIAETKFSWDIVLNALEHFYSKLLAMSS
jgi:glycosyltransferase involved in cell wall biosynthesis